MKRYHGERYIDFLKRVTESLQDGTIDYEEYGQSLLGSGVRYATDNWRKFYYVISKMLPLIESDIELEVTDETRLEQLTQKEQDAYKAAVRLRDQRRELRKWQTSEARYEHLVSILKDELQDCKNLDVMPYGEYRNLDVCKDTAVLMLSDWHAGAIIDNQFNFYDFEVLKDRAKRIFEKTIAYSIQHSVKDLYVEVNGDMIHGLINVSNRVQSEEDVIQQIIYVSKVLAELINGLKPFYQRITVVSTLGNHGRMFQDKTACVTKENFEKLIEELLKLRLDDEISLISTHSEDFTHYKIGDKVICVSHGHNDKLSTVVKDFCVLYKNVPDEIHLGHTHAFKDINDCDIMVTVNGSLQGTDDFALSIRKHTRPSQTLIVYGDDRCVYNLMAD